MQSNGNSDASAADREFVITRTFDAPASLVWKAWTDASQIGNWWGPDGFTTTTHSMDVREGGEWHFDMHGPDGRDYPNRIHYDAVEPNKRLVYSHLGTADVEPVNFQTTVTLEEQDARTKLTMRMIFPTKAERDRVIRDYCADDGAVQTISRLGDHVSEITGNRRAALTLMLPNECEIVMQREFEAPIQFVWEANTEPSLLKQWLTGPPGWSWVDCRNDVRQGGSYRWSWQGPDGKALAMHGAYREVDAPNRMVRTECFDVGCPAQSGEQLATLMLTEHNGRTRIKVSVVYPDLASRDAAIASGMEHGMSASYEQLDALITATASS